MKPAIIVAALAACVGLWSSNAGSIGADRPGAPTQDSKSESAAAAAANEAKEFKPPPGFVEKKRGQHVLYCKRDTTVGTRIKTENCYSEQQVRDYMLALKETRNNVDRIRNSCANICLCGSPEACDPTIREPNR